MTHRDFSGQYTDPELALRASLNFVVLNAKITAREIASRLDLAPSELSRMISLVPSEDASARRHMPLGRVVELMRVTGDMSPLATIAGCMGLDSDKLDFMQKDPAEFHRRVMQIAEQVQQVVSQLGMLGREEQPVGKSKARGKARHGAPR